MGSPRRLTLFACGILLFVGMFAVYNRFFGWANGLSPLPEKFTRRVVSVESVRDTFPQDKIERMLRLAFGDGCREVNYPIKFTVQLRGVVLAAEEFKFEDGRVKLTPLSLASFNKPKNDLDFPEINTLHCDVAYITFDRPVNSPNDFQNAKMVAADFVSDSEALSDDPRKGEIHLRNNRHTPQLNDDLVLRTRGPVTFRDDADVRPNEPQVFTRSVVWMTDYQNQPAPIGKDTPPTVEANGLRIYLSSSAIGQQPAAKKTSQLQPRNDVSVKKIELAANVKMDLWFGVDSGFMSPGGNAPAPSDERSRVHIETLGPFVFDMTTNRARFEKAPRDDGLLPNRVSAVRTHRDGTTDQLFCDTLELQFNRKMPPAAGAAGPTPPRAVSSSESDLEIESAHAFGKLVVLSSDSEKLTAWGNDLVYNQKTRQTVLKGAPMVAERDGSEIRAAELMLMLDDANAKNEKAGMAPKTGPKAMQLRQARAKGPGIVEMVNRNTKQRARARWNDLLLIDKDGNLDRITLTGGAVFEDREHDQRLEANQIRIWLEPKPVTETAGKTVAPPAPSGPNRRDNVQVTPHKLQADGRVIAHAPDVNVHDTDQVIVWFSDPPVLRTGQGVATLQPAVRPPAPNSAAPPAAPRLAADGPASPQTPRRPLDVSARKVEVFVLRGAQFETEKIHCDGRVKIHQESANPSERATDVAAHTLLLTRTPAGDVLVLTGTRSTPAEVHLHRMSIHGPEISVDQRDNIARVLGAGKIVMLASSDLQGNSLQQPKPVTILWHEEMTFQGRFAEFRGKVEAIQEQNRMTCHAMYVAFDRAVSLRQTPKPPPTDPSRVKEPANDQPQVVTITCDRDGSLPNSVVTFRESLYVNNKLARFQAVNAPAVTLHNDEGKLNGSGPGEVRIFQPGDPDPQSANPSNLPIRPGSKPSSPAPRPDQFTLTRVRFNGNMYGNNKTRSVNFGDNVRVVHLPAKAPDEAIDENRLPDGAFTMRCDDLTVFSRNTPDGLKSIEMTATGRADVFSKEFSGRADTIKYDESKQMVIFVGTESNPAKLYHIAVRGQSPKEVSAVKIYYDRRTNDFRIEKGNSVNSPQ